MMNALAERGLLRRTSERRYRLVWQVEVPFIEHGGVPESGKPAGRERSVLKAMKLCR